MIYFYFNFKSIQNKLVIKPWKDIVEKHEQLQIIYYISTRKFSLFQMFIWKLKHIKPFKSALSRLAVMVGGLSCATRIYKILCSNLSIIIHEMSLNKSLAAKLSRMTLLYRASISTLNGRSADIAVCEKKKTVETGCMWILIVTARNATVTITAVPVNRFHR